MTTITLEVLDAADCKPDADIDVLVLAEGDTEMQLGALIGNEPPEWVDAQGEILPRVTAWAQMPMLRPAAQVAGRIGREPDLVPLVNGRAVDFGGAWKLPC